MIGKRLMELRTELQLTQKELADRLGLTAKAISFYELEQREPSNETLKEMAALFNVSTDYLLGIVDVPNVEQLHLMNDTPKTITTPSTENLIKEIMAKNIKKYMKLNQVDNSKLCDDLGIKYSTFSDWINAKTYPKIDKIELMANYFGVTKTDLIEENILDAKDKSTPEELKFVTAEEAIRFVLEQNVVMGSGGFNFNSLGDEEKVEFANALLEHLKLLGLKYRK